jgi:hypothetical protein
MCVIKGKTQICFCIRDGGMDAMTAQLHLFLTSALGGDNWSA